MVRLILMALLHLYHSPQQRCMEARVDDIVARAETAENEQGVPAGLLLTVAYLETHIGCDHGEGGGWGAPVDMAHRHTAGTSVHAARALASSYRVCGGNWLRAVTRFRTGYCVFRRKLIGYEPEDAIRIARRVYDAAGISRPEGL